MANNELMRRNGEQNNLPATREEEWGAPSFPREMQQWMNQWNRWFDTFFNRSSALTPFRGLEQAWGSRWGSFVPAVNVNETDNEVRVTAELPGIDEKDIELSLNRDTLTIKGEKKEESEHKEAGYYRLERSYGSFHRTIPLPQEVDADRAEATFSKGVLTVTLPKLPELQSGARKIAIKGGESQPQANQ